MEMLPQIYPEPSINAIKLAVKINHQLQFAAGGHRLKLTNCLPPRPHSPYVLSTILLEET